MTRTNAQPLPPTMSYLAAYLGPEIDLHAVLMAPETGAYSHALTARHRGGPCVDGFGFGWHNAGRPWRYVRDCPIWRDPNLEALSRNLRAGNWLCSVQDDAESPDEISLLNTQPFRDERFLFTHQGFVDNFTATLKPACHEYLSPAVAADLRGASVSEYLFAMIRQRLRDPDHLDIAPALQDVLSTLEVSLRNLDAVLNVVICDGSRIIAARQAINQTAPPLYFNASDEHFPNAMLVASTPLTDSEHWRPVPEHHLLELRGDCDFKLTRL